MERDMAAIATKDTASHVKQQISSHLNDVMAAYESGDYERACEIALSENNATLTSQHIDMQNDEHIRTALHNIYVYNAFTTEMLKISSLLYRTLNISGYGAAAYHFEHRLPQEFGYNSLDNLPKGILDALEQAAPNIENGSTSNIWSNGFQNTLTMCHIYADIRAARGSWDGDWRRFDKKESVLPQANGFAAQHPDLLQKFAQASGKKNIFSCGKMFLTYGTDYSRAKVSEGSFAVPKVFHQYAEHMIANATDHETASKIKADYMAAIADGSCPSDLNAKVELYGYRFTQATDKIKKSLGLN